MKPLTAAQKELYDYLVEHIEKFQYSPTIREMMRAMHLSSPAPIQARLGRLRSKGYIDWEEGQARTFKITSQTQKGLPVYGAITAGGLVEPFTSVNSFLDLPSLLNKPDFFVLRVNDESMKGDFIAVGDYAIMRPALPDEELKEGEIVAVEVKEVGVTLKRLYNERGLIILKAFNSLYPPIETIPEKVTIKGILVGVWREIEDMS